MLTILGFQRLDIRQGDCFTPILFDDFICELQNTAKGNKKQIIKIEENCSCKYYDVDIMKKVQARYILLKNGK